MKEQIRLTVSSPPDREHLVVELWLGDINIGEVNREDGTIRIEMGATPEWSVDLPLLIDALKRAHDEIKTHR
jgi:hypothetical protein